MELNENQIKAVNTTEGPVLIVAGPGAGKTATIVKRLQNLVKEKKVKPFNILLLTFTNKAAEEMKERAEKELGIKLKDLTACTFHSFAVKMLRLFAEEVGYTNEFSVLSSAEAIDTLDLVKGDCMSKEKKDKSEYTHMDEEDFPRMSQVFGAISLSINKEIPLELVLKGNKKTKNHVPSCLVLASEYDKYKKMHNMMDFNDILINFNRLMEESKAASDYVNERFLYKMVDEYQDTNRLQLQMVKNICKKTDNIAVVGDIMQQLYSFNGADSKIMLNFPNYFPGTTIIKLNANYRSGNNIVGIANASADMAKDSIKNPLVTDKTGDSVKIIVSENELQANQRILRSVKELIEFGVSPSEIAILYRNSDDCIGLEKLLTLEKMPYIKYGGAKFFEQTFVLDIFAWLKVLINPWHEVAWFRIFKRYRGIGDIYGRDLCRHIMSLGVGALVNDKYEKRVFFNELVEIYNIYTALQKMEDLYSIVNYLTDYYFEHRLRVINESKLAESEKDKEIKAYLSEKENAPMFLEFALKYDSIVDFLTDFTVDSNGKDNKDDCVVLSTIHSSKGLEWDNVFVLNVSKNVFPNRYAKDDAIEDERCCFYVAVTRARKNLYISSPKTVVKFGRTIEGCGLSQYLTENPLMSTYYSVSK